MRVHTRLQPDTATTDAATIKAFAEVRELLHGRHSSMPVDPRGPHSDSPGAVRVGRRGIEPHVELWQLPRPGSRAELAA